jgi:hypothetical protein
VVGVTRWHLVIVLLVAVALRVSAAFVLGNQVGALPGTADQVSYHHLAMRVADGHGFSFETAWWPRTAAGAPTAHWSYLYTLYLAGVYALAGPNPLVARLIQAVVVGLLHPYLAYRLARLLVPADAKRSVPLLAAGLTAVYPYFIYYAATLMTEPAYIAAVLASLVIVVRLSQQAEKTGGIGPALLLGLALTAAVLLRQLFILLVPFLWLWLWLAGREARRAMVRTVLVSGGMLGLVLAITATYNYSRFNRFVLLNTNAGFAFYWANHPVYGDRFVSASDMDGAYGSLIPSELRHLDEASLDQELLRRGVGFVLDDPGRYVRLSLSRIPHYFKFWPDPSSSLLSNVVRVGSFGVLLPFILYGLIRPLAGAVRHRDTGWPGQSAAALVLIYGFIGAYTLVHLLSWAQIRYRLPVDAVLLVFAALAIADVINLADRVAKATATRRAAASP